MVRSNITKKDKRIIRHKKVRAKVVGKPSRPRLSIFKSNKFIYAQIIDDESGKTLVSESSKDQKGKGLVEKSKIVGQLLADKANKKGIIKVVFDRGGYIYTGVVSAFAEGARSGGLKF